MLELPEQERLKVDDRASGKDFINGGGGDERITKE